MLSEWRVPQSSEGETLLQFLRKKKNLTDLSARKIKSFIDTGLATVNGRTERFHHTVLSEFDIVTLIVPKEAQRVEFSKERVLYEDAFFLVYDKPTNVSCEEQGGIIDHFKSYPEIYMVHRLDKQTSGCLLLAKTKSIRDKLIEQFKSREIKKQYIAIVDGCIKEKQGLFKDFLVRGNGIEGQVIWRVSQKGGLLAETSFEIINTTKSATFIRLYPHTGRTHQLRVQLSFRNHPILGDRVYGKKFISSFPAVRQLLHAERLSFSHPEKDSIIDVSANYPDDIKEAIFRLFKEKV